MGTSAATPFAGIRVAAFEARMAGPMADLIEKHGGVPVEAPALREIPIADNPQALAIADRLLVGEYDVVVFETGVGVRYLSQAIETRIPRETWLAALDRTQVVARGPKPVAVLRELKARATSKSPSPTPGTRP